MNTSVISISTSNRFTDFDDVIASAVEEYLLRKHGISSAGVKKDARGIERVRKHCQCCKAVMSSTMQRLEAESSHSGSLIHVCHELGLEDHISRAKGMANRVVRRYSLNDAIAVLRDPSRRAELFKPVRK